MRYAALFVLMFAGGAQAATLEVNVTQGGSEPKAYTYKLSDQRQALDLREPTRYTLAVHDKARGKDICREAEYKTGMLVTLKQLEKMGEGQYKIEVVGQSSTLKTVEEGVKLSCGTNERPIIENTGFSDTSVLDVTRPKVLVIDGKTTLILTVKG